jgi:hypothetical protein
MSDVAKGIGAAVLALVVIAAIMLTGVYGFGWFSRATANYRGGTSAINQTRGNGSYRIAQYNHFYDLCGGIQTDQTRVVNARVALRGDKPTSDQYPEDKANLIAAENGLAGDVNQYNADARKTATAGQFRASDLPYQIDPMEGTITCTAS